MNSKSSDGPTAGNTTAAVGSGKWNRLLIALGSIVLFIMIALGLGLGLGLGLRSVHNHVHVSSKNATNTSTSDSLATNELWRLPASEYILDMESWDLNAAPTTRVYNFTISEIDAFPDGILRKVLVINGQYPAPVIRVNRGDRVLVNVTNELTNSTTLHWHGLFQNGTNWMDGVPGITQCGISPGRSFLYNFTVEGQYGTFWYHSHSDTQRMDGLFGPLIIHAPEEAEYQKRYGYTHDQIIIVQDYYHMLSAEYLSDYLASGNENAEPVPDNGLLQGTNYFNCSSYDPDSTMTCYDNSTRARISVEQDHTYRFRLINMGGFATFQFTIDNHTMTVIEGDSTMVEPLEVQTLKIAPAQRYSFLLESNKSAANYWIRAEMNTDCFASPNSVLNSTTFGILAYTDSDALPGTDSVGWPNNVDPYCEDLNATLLVPSEAQVAPAADHFFVIQFSFEIGDYALDRAYINGTSYTMSEIPTLNRVVPNLRAGNATYNETGQAPSYGLENQYILDIPTNQVVDILLQNFDDGSHPFHLHGYAFWVMASSQDQYFPWHEYDSINTTNPMRRDTVMVDAFSWTLIRIQADNPGMWAFHCHIAWHVAAGLLMQLQTRDDLMKDWTIPDDVLDLCVS
ncbi:hypothetical protein ARAM_007152 [Aspergillus rambellii]|uniref:Multicopper oxidase n=1 Tax=Aspergillus rambellii TaxID=308745 RepID=A0A0F8VRT7_9EURO|nr:hypothetical protein ARAM_007152 [Aspergillus rambellii]